MSAPAPASADEEYRLGTGDELRITVFGHEDLSMESVVVDSAGRITTPLAGDLRVVGQTLKEVEEQIESVLSPEYVKNPIVSVEVLEHRAFYIIGDCDKPPYVAGMRVIDLAKECSVTYRPNECVLVSRAGKEECAGPETLVKPGDVIVLPERYF